MSELVCTCVISMSSREGTTGVTSSYASRQVRAAALYFFGYTKRQKECHLMPSYIIIIYYLLRYFRYRRKKVFSLGTSYFALDRASPRMSSDIYQVSSLHVLIDGLTILPTYYWDNPSQRETACPNHWRAIPRAGGEIRCCPGSAGQSGPRPARREHGIRSVTAVEGASGCLR